MSDGGIVWDDEAAPAPAGPAVIAWDPAPRTAETERDPNPLWDGLASSVSAGSLVGAPRVLALEDAIRAKGRAPEEGFWDHYARRRDEYLAGQDRMDKRSPMATTVGKILNPQVLAGPLMAARSALAGTAGMAPTIANLAKQGFVQGAAATAGQGDADLTKGEVGRAGLETLAGGLGGAGASAAVGFGAKVLPAALSAGGEALGMAKGIAKRVLPVVGTVSRGARFANAAIKALSPEAASAAEGAVAAEAPTMAARAAAVAKGMPKRVGVEPFGVRYEPGFPAASGVGPLSGATQAAPGPAPVRTAAQRVKDAILKNPGVFASPRYGRLADMLMKALHMDESGDAGTDNFSRAHFILNNSDPDYQQMVKDLEE